ncbi:MAG: hypothetical protein GF375_00555, partial [Candidatus Omnitrophica bacterium]|nr:hypothetical protein [Candidatus Omnitrophota bacterium]MBD3268649.1 hypothetical protein [Candidatus Omnitrophota bacterium]
MSKKNLGKKILFASGGILFTLLLIELIMRLSGAFILMRESPAVDSLSKDNAYTIMCLGDSMTVSGGKGYTFPALLQEVLRERLPALNPRVINKGVSGADSLFILAHLRENIEEYDPDMVVVMMGFNDQLFAPSAYDNSFKSRIFTFFKSMRLYKLYRFLKFHLFE